jgi:hypothetical protein
MALFQHGCIYYFRRKHENFEDREHVCPCYLPIISILIPEYTTCISTAGLFDRVSMMVEGIPIDEIRVETIS